GIGIKKEFQSRIFEMFKRLHAENEYDGTGIGLSIVKKGAEMHGGHAEVLSHLGEGSTFSVFLPITGPEAGAAHERH
ncbi:MAG: ATP-binding protein, partial [Verrucomicrobiota bacterium]